MKKVQATNSNYSVCLSGDFLTGVLLEVLESFLSFVTAGA